MEIIQHNEERKGDFTAIEDGKQAGIMTYTWAGPHKFIIDHTEADPAFKGQGVGMQLLHQAVAYAREHDLKILPLCPYAKAMFERHSEIRDVLFST